jgi:CheY-like chemotaxis protein
MKTRKILIAEDDDSSRGIMEKLLLCRNYEVCSCALPEEAITRLKQEPFHILITDFQMPGMDGFELIRTARMTRPELMTIMMTGFPPDEIKHRATVERVNGFFSKPVDWDKLYTLLDILSEPEKLQDHDIPFNLKKERGFHLSRGITLGLIFILFALFDADLSKAQPPFHLPDRPMMRTDGPEVCWQSSDLALTETQMKAIERLRRDFAAETTPLRREIFLLRLEMRHLIRDLKVEPRVLLDRQKRISDLQVKLDNLSVSYQIKARSILTNEQLEQLPQDCSLEIEALFGTGTGMGRAPRRGFR